MAKRICVRCGKEKEVAGGKLCPKDHFTCYACSGASYCAVCSKPIK